MLACIINIQMKGNKERNKSKRIVDFYYWFLSAWHQSQTVLHIYFFFILNSACFLREHLCLHFYCYNIYQICDYFTVASYFVYQSTKRTPKWDPKDLLLFDMRIHFACAHKYSHLYELTNNTRAVYIVQRTKKASQINE